MKGRSEERKPQKASKLKFFLSKLMAENAKSKSLVHDGKKICSGLGTEYFRILLQSNCGVSVLDFVPQPEGGSPYLCLNRLNQTPSSPIASGSSAGRKASNRIVLVYHGNPEVILINKLVCEKKIVCFLNFLNLVFLRFF